ncbi:hypothetical protein PV10_01671 [Exophiala mesophila]|uniref:Uncharacterized protein n=1 Tax=Exophiala mesophila TaxID=212818 RepID=A0A0D1YBJ3_EXOME|nr:uncharacterized protein PV10_01671 [Exophiala mesophila]KIV97976.1 hypothetical protein PV10_01671 [Exophiala mesophila]
MSLTNPLHLYRHLLREATYLPLPNVRDYIAEHIRQSFRRYHKRQVVLSTITNTQDDTLPSNPSSSSLSHPAPFPSRTQVPGNTLTLQRQTTLLHNGRKFHSTLQRANAGYPRAMGKILRMSYGRTGRRRHELLDSYVAQTTRKTSTPLSPGPAKDKASPDWKIPAAMDALMQSQMMHQHQFIRWGTNSRVRMPMKISPERNIRGDPICKSRRKNMLHAWYLSNVRAVMAPLPEREYSALHRLVSGEDPMPKPPTRRPRARVPVLVVSVDEHSSVYTDDKDKDIEEWLREEDEDVANIKTFAATQSLAQSNPQTPASLIVNGPVSPPRHQDRPRQWDTRNLRRLLQRAVLTQTPVVKRTPSFPADLLPAAGEVKSEHELEHELELDQSDGADPNQDSLQTISPKPRKPLAVVWDDGYSRKGLLLASIKSVANRTQGQLLFG